MGLPPNGMIRGRTEQDLLFEGVAAAAAFTALAALAATAWPSLHPRLRRRARHCGGGRRRTNCRRRGNRGGRCHAGAVAPAPASTIPAAAPATLAATAGRAEKAVSTPIPAAITAFAAAALSIWTDPVRTAANSGRGDNGYLGTRRRDIRR